VVRVVVKVGAELSRLAGPGAHTWASFRPPTRDLRIAQLANRKLSPARNDARSRFVGLFGSLGAMSFWRGRCILEANEGTGALRHDVTLRECVHSFDSLQLYRLKMTFNCRTICFDLAVFSRVFLTRKVLPGAPHLPQMRVRQIQVLEAMHVRHIIFTMYTLLHCSIRMRYPLITKSVYHVMSGMPSRRNLPS
jgi:hypothetical protein